MDGNVLVSLFESVVLDDVVQVVPSDDDGVFHLGRDDQSLDNGSSDGDISGEWALLVDVCSGSCLLWSFEAQTDVLDVSESLLDSSSAQVLLVHEDSWLLHKRLLSLLGKQLRTTSAILSFPL